MHTLPRAILPAIFAAVLLSSCAWTKTINDTAEDTIVQTEQDIARQKNLIDQLERKRNAAIKAGNYGAAEDISREIGWRKSGLKRSEQDLENYEKAVGRGTQADGDGGGGGGGGGGSF